MNKFNTFVAIDPMALLLTESVYQKWVELRHPHVPKVTEVQEVLRNLPAEEQKVILTRAQQLAEFANVIQEAIGAKIKAA